MAEAGPTGVPSAVAAGGPSGAGPTPPSTAVMVVVSRDSDVCVSIRGPRPTSVPPTAGRRRWSAARRSQRGERCCRCRPGSRLPVSGRGQRSQPGPRPRGRLVCPQPQLRPRTRPPVQPRMGPRRPRSRKDRVPGPWSARRQGAGASFSAAAVCPTAGPRRWTSRSASVAASRRPGRGPAGTPQPLCRRQRTGAGAPAGPEPPPASSSMPHRGCHPPTARSCRL